VTSPTVGPGGCLAPDLLVRACKRRSQAASHLRTSSRDREELAKEQAEVKAQLVKLAPAWAELRKVLNELNRVIGVAESGHER